MTRKEQESEAVSVTPEIEMLADGLRGEVGREGAERALAAFREARGTTAQLSSQRPRRRDDWRPGRRRFSLGVSLRAGLGAALAGVTLGGVAMAVGAGVLPVPFAPTDTLDRQPSPPSGVEAPGTPGGTAPAPASEPSGRGLPSPGPSVSGDARDAPAANRGALCRAWTRGERPHRGVAFERLTEPAGGAGAVDDHCATSPEAKAKVPPAPRRPAEAAVPGRPKAPQSAAPSRGRSGEHARGGDKRS
ncbi:hypothetical protein QFZ71_000302 [Streptomyces sp. V2I9]|nr:hypothetical protein [Streptomyces sp. V2I9]